MPPRAAAKNAATGRWLTEDEAAEKTGFSVAAFKKWRREGTGPDYVKGDGRAGGVRYPEPWIDEWAQSHRVSAALPA